MISLGIMSLQLDSETTYIDEMAALAESCGITCFRFVPTKMNPHTLQIQGKRYDSKTKTWLDDEFPIPAILYDRCFYGEDDLSKQSLPIVTWLKNKKEITFLGYGLPNKLELYEALKKSVLSAYLPPTKAAVDASAIVKELTSRKKLILKPINGSQGFGIYFIKKNERTIHVKTEKQRQIISRIFPNEAKLMKWLLPLLTKHQYLLQPYLELSNDELQPFDIRVFLQKNDQGSWMEMGRGIRTGNTGGILSNLSAGGTVTSFTDWISTLPPAKAGYIQEELTYILGELPKLLEKEFLPLFELGVDIGVAKNGSIWILDINSKPGRKVLLQTRPELKQSLFRAPLLYANYLSQTGHEERKRFYEKTLSH